MGGSPRCCASAEDVAIVNTHTHTHNAGGHQRCRFCSFGEYEEIECPATKLVLKLVVEGTVEEFDAKRFVSNLAKCLGVPSTWIKIRVAPASVMVTSNGRAK